MDSDTVAPCGAHGAVSTAVALGVIFFPLVRAMQIMPEEILPEAKHVK